MLKISPSIYIIKLAILDFKHFTDLHWERAIIFFLIFFFFFLLTDFKNVPLMKWRCKFCAFSTNGQGRILQHYKECHGHHRRSSGLTCIHKDCLKSFQTQAELKNHLKERKKGYRILTKLSVDGRILFIIELLYGFLEHLRCYQLAKKDPAVTMAVQPEQLNDYIPLVAYLVDGKLLITPRTFMLQ